MLELLERDQETFLVAVEITPAWQNRGVGASILRWIIQEATRRGQPVRLRVLRSNPRARRFYERAGFALVAATELYDEYLRDLESPTPFPRAWSATADE